MKAITFQMSKDELLLPARSESSCSLQSRELLASSSHSLESSNISPELGGPLCDTSSEVSDEGYKSSQGNVSSKTGTNPGLVTTANTQEDGERPESSMTVGSDCSSTISSEEDEEDNTASSHLEDHDGSSSLTVIAASPEKK